MLPVCTFRFHVPDTAATVTQPPSVKPALFIFFTVLHTFYWTSCHTAEHMFTSDEMPLFCLQCYFRLCYFMLLSEQSAEQRFSFMVELYFPRSLYGCLCSVSTYGLLLYFYVARVCFYLPWIDHACYCQITLQCPSKHRWSCLCLFLYSAQTNIEWANINILEIY